MFRYITPVDATVFTGIAGLVMVLTGHEIAGAIVLSSSLGAFIFFEWYLFRRKTDEMYESAEYRQMMYAAGQWEKSIVQREQELERREAALNEQIAKLREGGEKGTQLRSAKQDIKTDRTTEYGRR